MLLTLRCLLLIACAVIASPALSQLSAAQFPDQRIKRLHDALRRATEDPAFIKALDDIGLKSGYITPEAFDETVAKAEARAVPLLKELKLTSQ